MSARVRQGLTIVPTGDGKGKSTAASGMVLRAWSRHVRVWLCASEASLQT